MSEMPEEHSSQCPRVHSEVKQRKMGNIHMWESITGDFWKKRFKGFIGCKKEKKKLLIIFVSNLNN